MPMHALARFSEYPRVFTFFFSLDGRCRRHLFSLSCVGADFVAPSSQRSRGECWGKRSSAFFSRTSSRRHPRGNFPQFLPQDSRDGRCPGNLVRSNVTLLRSPSFSADWSMSCEFCPLVAIFLSRILADSCRRIPSRKFSSVLAAGFTTVDVVGVLWLRSFHQTSSFLPRKRRAESRYK